MDHNTANPGFGDGTDWEAVGRYLSGESSPDEVAAVRRLLDESPPIAALVSALQARDSLLDAGAPIDVEAALSRVHARLDEPVVVPLANRRRRLFPLGGSRTPAFAIAAALSLMVGGAVLWRAVRSPAELAPVAAALHYETAVGAMDSITLADGSVAVLGPASSLDVDGGYGMHERAVSLQGEGFFIVRHDERHPFVVRAGATRIRDVGTAFSVRRRGDGVVRVAVTEGVVAVRSTPSADEVELRAGDAITSAATGFAVVEREPVVASDTAWKRGQLIFADAPMDEVRDGVRRWYGVEIRLDSALARRHVTATFQGEPVDRVLDVIALTLGASVEQRGDTIVIRRGKKGVR